MINMHVKKIFFNYSRTRGNVLKRSLSPCEDSTIWDMLEADEPDVFEYLKSLENKSELETQMKNKLKESEGDLSKVKMEPSDENNANLLNVKTSALSKTYSF